MIFSCEQSRVRRYRFSGTGNEAASQTKQLVAPNYHFHLPVTRNTPDRLAARRIFAF